MDGTPGGDMDTLRRGGEGLAVSALTPFENMGGQVAEASSPHDLGVTYAPASEPSEKIQRALAELIREYEMESDRKSTRLNSSHIQKSRMPSSA